MHRLVDVVWESFGHLNSSLCLLSKDRVNRIVDIGKGKLGYMTSSGFLWVRKIFGMRPIDGSSAHTSGGGNRVNKISSIELREDSDLLSGGKRYHDGNDWE